MQLIEHVHCVGVTFKMTEQVEQRICIKFCVKLEHSSVETIWMIQKAAAMGNWWLTALSWQRACSCIMSLAEFFGETANHPGHTAPLQPRFGTWWLLSFPKLTFWLYQNHLWKGRDFRSSMRFRKMWRGSWWWLGELCEVPTCLFWRGLRLHCPMYSISCILYLL